MATQTMTAIAIMGIRNGSFGCSCSLHPYCGCLIDLNAVIRLKMVHFQQGKWYFGGVWIAAKTYPCLFGFASDGEWKALFGAFIVIDGIDHCQVGYLPPEYPLYDSRLDNRLVQVVDILDESTTLRKRSLSDLNQGLCVGVIIDRRDVDSSGLEGCIEEYLTDSSIDE